MSTVCKWFFHIHRLSCRVFFYEIVLIPIRHRPTHQLYLTHRLNSIIYSSNCMLLDICMHACNVLYLTHRLNSIIYSSNCMLLDICMHACNVLRPPCAWCMRMNVCGFFRKSKQKHKFIIVVRHIVRVFSQSSFVGHILRFLPFLSDTSSRGYIWLGRTYLAGTDPIPLVRDYSRFAIPVLLGLDTLCIRYGRGQHKTGSFGDDMLRPSPNHGTQRLPNDDEMMMQMCSGSI